MVVAGVSVCIFLAQTPKPGTAMGSYQEDRSHLGEDIQFISFFQLTVLGLHGVNGTRAAPHVDLALSSAPGQSLWKKGMVVHA